MKRTAACLALICLLAAGAQASINVSLGTSGPLVVAPGGVSGTMTVSVTNLSGPSVPADNVSGWQTTLMIVPTGGTGTVGFVTPSLPSSYIFSSIPSSGLSSSISTSTNPNDTLLAFDFNFPFTGGTPLTSANLLDLSFSVSAGASGSFGVFALGLPSSEWTDSTPAGQMDQAYSNVGTGGSTQIGSILVQDGGSPVIPEPFSFLTWTFLGGVGFVVFYLRRPRQNS